MLTRKRCLKWLEVDASLNPRLKNRVAWYKSLDDKTQLAIVRACNARGVDDPIRLLFVIDYIMGI